MKPEKTIRWLTMEEASAALRISTRTLRRYLKARGVFPLRRFGRAVLTEAQVKSLDMPTQPSEVRHGQEG